MVNSYKSTSQNGTIFTFNNPTLSCCRTPLMSSLRLLGNVLICSSATALLQVFKNRTIITRLSYQLCSLSLSCLIHFSYAHIHFIFLGFSFDSLRSLLCLLWSIFPSNSSLLLWWFAFFSHLYPGSHQLTCHLLSCFHCPWSPVTVHCAQAW